MQNTVEANFDGLVGPTHNYSGLSFGNVASSSHEDQPSNPKEAALQGLQKMKSMHDLGLVQGVLPPQERPDVWTLRKLGFAGNDQQVMEQAAGTSPKLWAACCSASCMWAANAATVSPSSDTADHKLHFTPANLVSKFHRSIEHESTGRILKAIFPNEEYFVHHPALAASDYFGDEGAANHTRFCQEYGDSGVEFFVYGRSAFDSRFPAPIKFPARQTLEASSAIVRLHQLDSRKTVFAQQNPEVIDSGVFHNDVIAVGNRNVSFFHEKAFLDKQGTNDQIQAAFGEQPFYFIEVPDSQVSVKDAVSSYLFNSQLISITPEKMAIVVPEECQMNPNVWKYLQQLTSDANPIQEVIVFDLKQSMNNGGGPACLRLRVVLNPEELKQVNAACIINDALFTQLNGWVEKHYRDRLQEKDLADPLLLTETRTALDELTQIMNLGSIYRFQKKT